MTRQVRSAIAFIWGAVIGTLGGLLLGIVPAAILLPALATILLISALRIWRHGLVRATRPQSERTL